MEPEATGTRPSTARASVDLPEPDSPTSPSVSFGIRSRSTPSSAFSAGLRRECPKGTARSVTSSSGSGCNRRLLLGQLLRIHPPPQPPPPHFPHPLPPRPPAHLPP